MTFVLVHGGGHGGWCWQRTASEDAVFSPELARAFAARLPGAPFAEVEAGHDLMITKPVETAAALLAVS
jgi:pimeloyl-ACP methyl ester carboxylesterase